MTINANAFQQFPVPVSAASSTHAQPWPRVYRQPPFSTLTLTAVCHTKSRLALFKSQHSSARTDSMNSAELHRQLVHSSKRRSSSPRALEAAIDRGIHIGRHRTLTQDSEFGIAQVVEIAIRALSPAVNDTFTGVACVDWLADALLTLAERPPLEGNWYDTGSRLGYDAAGAARASRQARVRSDPSGLRDDTRCADPPARRHPPAGTATSRRLPSSAVGSSGRDPRNRERAGRARSPRPRCGVAPGTHRARSAAQPSKPCLNHLSRLLHLVREPQNSSRA